MGQGELPFRIDIEDTIVKEIKESLRPIARYCPDEIVKNAREKESKVKKSNKKELPNVFIQLDNEIKIDVEDGHIKEFSETILKFVEGIALFFEKISGLTFKINPAGSFPLGNKIEQIDEFDFVLEWINMPKELADLYFLEFEALQYCRTPANNSPGMIITSLFRELSFDLQDVEKVTINTLIQKKFATNLVILWECSYHHKHEVSLDLAFSLKLKDPMKNYCDLRGRNFKNTPFEKAIESHEFTYVCFPFLHQMELGDLFLNCRVDTNYYDKLLFERCDKISPNIKLSFRIIKFICSKVFPRRCENRKCMLQRKDVCEFEPFISSYILKQLLFKEVLEFPSSKEWSVAFIHLRVTSLLKRLLKITEINDFLNPMETKDIRKEKKELQIECFNTCLNKLISWFENDFTKGTEDLTPSNAADGSRQGWFLGKVLIITVKEPKMFKLERLYPILKLDMPGTRWKTSNTKKIIYDMCNEIISDAICVDLTAHNELYFPLFVYLYSEDCGVFEEQNFKSNRVIEKLSIIIEIVEKFEIDLNTMVTTLIKRFNDNHVAKVRSIFSQVTMKEAGSIYRYFKQQASRNEKAVYNVIEHNINSMLGEGEFKNTPPLSEKLNNTDFDEKGISLLESFFHNEEVAGCFSIHKASLWLYCAVMESIGKI